MLGQGTQPFGVTLQKKYKNEGGMGRGERPLFRAKKGIEEGGELQITAKADWI